MGAAEEYQVRIASMLASLQIPRELVASRALPLQAEAEELVVAEVGRDGREHQLIPPAAEAWRAMRVAAQADGVAFEIASAFRGVERQAEIVRDKLARGLTPAQILAVSAPPGYSEHHSGCAVDVTTDGVPPFGELFEATAAYDWLHANAGAFSFFLSFPRDNRYGYAFEPWHWCYRREIAQG